MFKKKGLIAFLCGAFFAIITYILIKDVVTAVCIGIIFGFFGYFLQEIMHLRSACNIIKKLDRPQLLDSLSESEFQDIANNYKKTIKIDIDRVKKTNIPSVEFLNLQTIAKQYDVNLRVLDTASSSLVGLGLMGTFIGLTIGIANFDSSNSENIQSSIQTLLNGMSIAFLTSLVGMFLSIVNTGIDKHWRNATHLLIKDITDELDTQYFIDDLELMEYKQRKMLEFNDEDGNKVSVSSAIGHIMEENKSQTAALSSFNTDLSTMLNNSLGEQIDKKLSPIMNSVIEHIDKMAETVVTPANDLMEKVSTELKDSMTLIVEEFRKRVSDTATQQLESISQSLTTASKSIDVLPENVTNAVESMKEAVANVQKSMLKLTEDIMSKQADLLALQESTTKESASLIENLKLGIDRLEQVNENYKNTAESFGDAHTKMFKTLGNLSLISDNMAEAIDNFKDSQEEYSEKMKSLQIDTQGNIDSVSQLVGQSGELSYKYASQFGVIKEGLVEIFGKLKEGLEDYSKTMQQTTQDYLQQYTSTLTETADNLKTSIDIMGDTIAEFSEVLEKYKK